MSVILFVWFCAVCVFVLPPKIACVVLLCAAALRILYVTRESAIDAAAEVARMPGEIISDWRRNGLSVLRTVLWWSAGISAWLAVVWLFKIPF